MREVRFGDGVGNSTDTDARSEASPEGVTHGTLAFSCHYGRRELAGHWPDGA